MIQRFLRCITRGAHAGHLTTDAERHAIQRRIEELEERCARSLAFVRAAQRVQMQERPPYGQDSAAEGGYP